MKKRGNTNESTKSRLKAVKNCKKTYFCHKRNNEIRGKV